MNAAVINKNAKLQRVPEACADTNWSRNTLMKVAAEANAIIRVGRTVRIDMPVLYKYIDMVYNPSVIMHGAKHLETQSPCRVLITSWQE